ncbi:hypothetical protein PSPO01_00245 [Paraphaeosphaeria sporulosa]
MPKLTAPALHDPCSPSLRIMSYRIRRMCLFAVINRPFFFLLNDGSLPSWP